MYIYAVSKKIPDIFDCNLKKNYQILIIFDVNISETTGHHTTVSFPPHHLTCACALLGKTEPT